MTLPLDGLKVWSRQEFILDISLFGWHYNTLEGLGTTTTVHTQQGRKEMFYLTTHSTHFIYGYMASDIWLRTILIVRKETRCCQQGFFYMHHPTQDNTYHGHCYTSRGALAGTGNSSMDPSHHERTLLPRSYISLPGTANAVLEQDTICVKIWSALIE